jgi:hypothetical protein
VCADASEGAGVGTGTGDGTGALEGGGFGSQGGGQDASSPGQKAQCGPYKKKDSTSWYAGGNPKKTCEKVAKKLERCDEWIGQDDVLAKYACPKTCKSCRGCSDDRHWRITDQDTGRPRTCSWVAKDHIMRCYLMGWGGTRAYKACRLSCDACFED